jgi:RluA family pseudouridine synthase
LEKIQRVDGTIPKKGLLLHGGEKLEFLDPNSFEEEYEADPEVPWSLVAEEPSFLVVEKPSGIPVHPMRPGERMTLIQGVLSRYPEIASVGSKREMGLVHRLDNDTSGLVLVARTPEAYDFLREEFRRHRVKKEYWALVRGKIPKKKEEAWEKIDMPIGHHPKSKKKMVVIKMRVGQGQPQKEEGRGALTYYKVEKHLPHHSLLRIQIPTGVRHQIRVHLAHLSHPVVGDRLYGGEEGPRLFLHATGLRFRHPMSLKPVAYASPLPGDLKRQLNRCILEA